MVDLHITIEVLNCLVNKLVEILILLLSPIFIDIKVILLCFFISTLYLYKVQCFIVLHILNKILYLKRSILIFYIIFSIIQCFISKTLNNAFI